MENFELRNKIKEFCNEEEMNRIDDLIADFLVKNNSTAVDRAEFNDVLLRIYNKLKSGAEVSETIDAEYEYFRRSKIDYNTDLDSTYDKELFEKEYREYYLENDYYEDYDAKKVSPISFEYIYKIVIIIFYSIIQGMISSKVYNIFEIVMPLYTLIFLIFYFVVVTFFQILKVKTENSKFISTIQILFVIFSFIIIKYRFLPEYPLTSVINFVYMAVAMFFIGLYIEKNYENII